MVDFLGQGNFTRGKIFYNFVRFAVIFTPVLHYGSPLLALCELREGSLLCFHHLCFSVHSHFDVSCTLFWFSSMAYFYTCPCFSSYFYITQWQAVHSSWSLCYFLLPPKLLNLQMSHSIVWSFYVVSRSQAHFPFGSEKITRLIFLTIFCTILYAFPTNNVNVQKKNTYKSI